MPIQTITQVTIPFCLKLKKKGELVDGRSITLQNKRRDRLIKTDQNIYYLKFQNEKKLVNHWDNREVQFRTVNKKLADDITFDYLVIGDSEGKHWITHRENVLTKGKVRTQYGGEITYCLEEKYFEEMV